MDNIIIIALIVLLLTNSIMIIKQQRQINKLYFKLKVLSIFLNKQNRLYKFIEESINEFKENK